MVLPGKHYRNDEIALMANSGYQVSIIKTIFESLIVPARRAIICMAVPYYGTGLILSIYQSKKINSVFYHLDFSIVMQNF